MMKKHLYNSILFTLLLSSCSILSAQAIFVKQNASGANDGSSWANAYTNLETALDNHTSGDVWIAAGNHKPSPMSSFQIRGGMNLYGGFAGTETMLSERDYLNNPTILSGDLNDDDVQGDFSLNKDDNLLHVVVVDSLLSTPVRLDGLFVIGGNTTDNSDLDEFEYRGGGVFAYSSIEVYNCSFQNNFARSGASIYVSPFTGGGDNSTFENCIFSNNYTSSQSAGIYINSLSNITVEGCTFSDNITVRGTFYPAYCNNVLVNNCIFENNESFFSDGFGGPLFSWQTTNYLISNSTFIGNSAGNGGVMYYDGRELTPDPNNLVFQNCTFEANAALDWGGGAIYTFTASFTIEDCVFKNNIAPNSGAHFFAAGDEKEIIVRNTTFEDGIATFGGAHNCYGETSVYTLENNTYRNCFSGTSGGAIIAGFKSNTTITGCTFELNDSDFGGAIYVQNDTTAISITDCVFNSNTATNNGGAVNNSGGNSMTIDNSTFEGNNADFGGAIFSGEFGGLSENNLMLTNSTFLYNTASTQAAAINILDADASLYNLLVTNCINTGAGAGGALSVNATDSNTMVVNLINSTFADNEAPIGAGIATFTDSLESFLTLNLQNNLLYNVGNNYEVEGGFPTVVSNGGNLSGDASATSVLTNAKDQNEADDPLFADPNDFDYHLTSGSPAINAGVADGAPEFDLEGNPRLADTDAGCYEAQEDVAIEDLITNNGMLRVFPNPTVKNIELRLDNNWSGNLSIRIIDNLGKTVKDWKISKTQNQCTRRIDVSNFATGAYKVVISDGNRAVVQQFVKL